MSELSNKLDYTNDTKELIKAALQSKHVAVTDQDTFRSYAEKIVNMTDIVADELNVTPTTNQQILTPTGQYNTYSKVTVSAVTSSIDANIIPENIKEGVTILGVTGTLRQSEDLNTELTALENQTTLLQNAINDKTPQ